MVSWIVLLWFVFSFVAHLVSFFLLEILKTMDRLQDSLSLLRKSLVSLCSQLPQSLPAHPCYSSLEQLQLVHCNPENSPVPASYTNLDHPLCPILLVKVNCSFLERNLTTVAIHWEHPPPTSLFKETIPNTANTLGISCAGELVNIQVWLYRILILLPGTWPSFALPGSCLFTTIRVSPLSSCLNHTSPFPPRTSHFILSGAQISINLMLGLKKFSRISHKTLSNSFLIFNFPFLKLYKLVLKINTELHM